MRREIELNGKHKGDEPILCEIVVERFVNGFNASSDSLDDSYLPSCDFYVEGIDPDMEELYKDEIMSEVIYMRMGYGESADYDEGAYEDQLDDYHNEDGDSPF